MIRCPKCDFEQPPDTYCANCGVNMETFKRKPAPLLLSLLGNWLFQLGIVIAFIIGLVSYDKLQGQKKVSVLPSKQVVTTFESGPVEKTVEITSSPQNDVSIRNETNDKDSESSSNSKTTSVFSAMKKKLLSDESSSSQNDEPVPAVSSANVGIEVSFFQASKNILLNMQKEAKSTLSGDSIGGILTKKRLEDYKNNGNLRSVSTNKYNEFELNQPILIFKGQRGLQGTKNLGIYFQIIPVKKENNTVQIEMKSWGNLKEQGSDESLFNSDFSLTTKSMAFVTGFLPKDQNLTDEEKSLFEQDRTLKIMTKPEFWDDSIDLVMTVELTERN